MSSAQLRYMPPVIINNPAVSLCKLDLQSRSQPLYLLLTWFVKYYCHVQTKHVKATPVPEKLDVPKFSISLNSVTLANTSNSSNCALFKSNMDQCKICKRWVRFSSTPSLNEAIACWYCRLYFCQKTSTCGKSYEIGTSGKKLELCSSCVYMEGAAGQVAPKWWTNSG